MLSFFFFFFAKHDNKHQRGLKAFLPRRLIDLQLSSNRTSLVAQTVMSSPATQEMGCQPGDVGSIPGSGRYSGGGNDNPLQYSCLGNTMDRGTWQATIHGIARVGHNLMTKPSPCSNKPCGQGQLHNLQNPVQNKNVGSFVLKTGKSVSKHITISNFSFLPQSLSSSHGGFYSVFNGVHS